MGILKKVQAKYSAHYRTKRDDTSPSFFFDKDSCLTWKSVNTDNIDSFDEEFNSLNSWSTDSNIRRFISSRQPLDFIFKLMIPDHNDRDHLTGLYFAYDNNQFVGLLHMSAPIGDNKHATIEFIITNPKLRNRGYATRMISSAKNNLEFFCHGHSGEGIASTIERENIGSITAFVKNGFKHIGNNSSSGRAYQIYFLKPRNISSDTHQSDNDYIK